MQSTPHSVEKPSDYRLVTLLGLLITVGSIGYLFTQLTDQVMNMPDELPSVTEPSERFQSVNIGAVNDRLAELGAMPDIQPMIDPKANPMGHQTEAFQAEIQQRFKQATTMLYYNRYDEAITALHRLLRLDPEMPEAYVNMGYALLGKQEYKMAHDFFLDAIDMNPGMANAYYGIALALEGLGELGGALGGMRSYLHMVEVKEEAKVNIARARSAIWEWEAQLGRGPWGETKGIIPGLTREDQARDEYGTATMMPVPGTEDNQGIHQFKVEASERTPPAEDIIHLESLAPAPELIE